MAHPLCLSLLYDGDCPLCRNAVSVLQTLGLLAGVNAVSWQTADIADDAMAERIRREILLYDPERQQVFGGIDTIVQLAALSPRWRWTASTLQWPPLKHFLDCFYNLIAANRRILSPIPPQPFPCACDPPDNPAARRRLFLLLWLCCILSGWFFCIVTASASPDIPNNPAPILAMIFILLLPWITPMIGLALSRQREALSAYAGQWSVIGFLSGVALLLTSALFLMFKAFLFQHCPACPFLQPLFFPAGLLLALAVMDFNMRHRYRTIPLSTRLYNVWLLGWYLAVLLAFSMTLTG